jgi:hypothetical protein
VRAQLDPPACVVVFVSFSRIAVDDAAVNGRRLGRRSANLVVISDVEEWRLRRVSLGSIHALGSG